MGSTSTPHAACRGARPPKARPRAKVRPPPQHAASLTHPRACRAAGAMSLATAPIDAMRLDWGHAACGTRPPRYRGHALGQAQVGVRPLPAHVPLGPPGAGEPREHRFSASHLCATDGECRLRGPAAQGSPMSQGPATPSACCLPHSPARVSRSRGDEFGDRPDRCHEARLGSCCLRDPAAPLPRPCPRAGAGRGPATPGACATRSAGGRRTA